MPLSKCPYCSLAWTTEAAMVTHVTRTHRLTHESMLLKKTAFADREVELVGAAAPELTGPACESCGERPNYGLYENCYGQLFCQPCADGGPEPERKPVLCVCGLELVLMDASTDDPWWTHAVPTPKCRQAAPACGQPTAEDRRSLDVRLSETGAGLAEAGRELHNLRETLDGVDAALMRIQNQLRSPSVVRRATLNQVWDRLSEAGHTNAAMLVMKMIDRVVDET